MSVVRRCIAAGLVAVVVAAAAPAAAEPANGLAQGIAGVRAATLCSPLRHDELVEWVADISNRSTVDYRNHDARFVPVDDPLLVLRDFGAEAEQAIQLRGHGHTDADAIKGALLQGHSAIADCRYTIVGTSLLRDPQSGYTMVVAVLAG